MVFETDLEIFVLVLGIRRIAMLLKGASGGSGLAPPFLTLGLSSEEEDDDRLPNKIPDLDAHNPPTDDEGIM